MSQDHVESNMKDIKKRSRGQKAESRKCSGNSETPSEQADGRRYRAASEICVRELRMILLWPLYLPGSEDWESVLTSPTPEHGATWSTTEPGDDPLGLWGSERYAEFVYFHPFVQELFHSNRSDRTPVRRLTRSDIGQLTVQLTRSGRFVCNVERCDLYLFSADTAILTLEVRIPTEETPLCLDKALRLRDAIRRSYPPYAGAIDQEYFPEQVTVNNLISHPESMDDYIYFTKKHRASPVAPHWQTIMRPLRPYGEEGAKYTYQQLGDERQFIMTYLAVDDPCEISPQDWTRIAFVEEPGAPTQYPYADRFLADFEPRTATTDSGRADKMTGETRATQSYTTLSPLLASGETRPLSSGSISARISADTIST